MATASPPRPYPARSEEAALLAGICAQPDADLPRLVYADWLDERGGDANIARAAFIRAQIELTRPAAKGEGPRRQALRKTVRETHKRHVTEWMRPIRAVVPPPNKYNPGDELEFWDRGFLHHLTVQHTASWQSAAPVLLTFCPINSLYVLRYDDASLTEFAALAENRWLHRFSVCGSSHANQTCTDAAAMALAQSPHFSSLRELSLIQNQLTTAGVQALAHSEHLNTLTKLELYGNALDDETYRVLAQSPLATRMTEWWVDGCDVTSAAARILATSEHLRHVTGISFSNTGVGDDGIAALAEAQHLSGLKYLNLRTLGGTFTRDAIRSIARSPVLANLEEIDLQKTWIDGIGAKYLRESPYLKKIKVLALYDSVPHASESKLIERFGKRVDFGRR